jgi:hypothetical protein
MLTYFQDPKTTLYAVVVAVVLSLIVGIMIGVYGFNKSGFASRRGTPWSPWSNDISFPKNVDSNFQIKLSVNEDSPIFKTLAKTIKDVNKTAWDNQNLKKDKKFEEEVLIAVAALDGNTTTGLGEVRVVMSSKNPDGTWKTLMDSVKTTAEASTLMDNYLKKAISIKQALQNLPDKKK